MMVMMMVSMVIIMIIKLIADDGDDLHTSTAKAWVATAFMRVICPRR
jgi:hypothetical protein